MSTPVTIHKRDHTGRETWQYSGTVLDRGATWINFEARFNIPGEKDAGYTIFRFNDRFVEWCFTDYWYNIAAVHDVADDHLKGWYCNVSRPAVIIGEMTVDIFWDDLALDVWVAPDGTTQLLDEDEFTALNLDTETQAQAWLAVEQLRALVKTGAAPFNMK